MQTAPVILLKEFIQATRDSGYKGAPFAIAELVDNALEAHARHVFIDLTGTSEIDGRSVNVVVTDDGAGMSPSELMLALQFGGSTRFGTRTGLGRYGMGLPNSSLSQARRFEVYSWRERFSWWTYFDLDEFITGTIDGIPAPKRRQPDFLLRRPNTGTVILWKKCDRIDPTNLDITVASVRKQLGRVFRRHLISGRHIYVNGDQIRPYDPLFLTTGSNLIGANQYGPPLVYDIEVPGQRNKSRVTVRFSELPVAEWHAFSNQDKKAHGISKRAGVSVLRAGREIDYGWFFMGNKRKENYDDWWRCEVEFHPELDEYFGVTHTKQEIHPTKTLLEILNPDIERIAHELNSRVRKSYAAVKAARPKRSATTAERRDHLIAPPVGLRNSRVERTTIVRPSGKIGGLNYEFSADTLDDGSFFIAQLQGKRLSMRLNTKHAFYEKVYSALQSEGDHVCQRRWELVLLALARAECNLKKQSERRHARRLRELWSDVLTAFLN